MGILGILGISDQDLQKKRELYQIYGYTRRNAVVEMGYNLYCAGGLGLKYPAVAENATKLQATKHRPNIKDKKPEA